MIYYVSCKNTVSGDGSEKNPFRTISQAAAAAMPGDKVIIGGGIYREWVKPQNGGLGNNQRIVYEGAAGQEAVISGAEVISGWENVGGTVWRASVSNEVFGEKNPYAEEIFGDWYDGLGQVHHVGELYVDGQAMYEAAALEKVYEQMEPGARAFRWFAQVQEEETVFYGNFCGKAPNECLTEISVRPCCFFPEREGVGYITVSNLTMRQGAPQWAPPTAFQPGLVGPHWSKGWIIEKCKIHDSKCCGISLGKKHDIKDNCWSKDPSKGGAQTYTEIIFSNLRDGWNKEKIGSHIVRNNEIYNCGQAGIIGNMGGAFSEITGNYIHNINDRGEVSGAEMAGVKLHAAIDTVVADNMFHHCTNGLWLDWEAQGAQVRRNVFFENNEDLFIEVSHGPAIVESNLLLSERNFFNVSQGTACVHNLFAGELTPIRDVNRFTLYHLPHSTMVGGVMLVYGGDDKIMNNIFVGTGEEKKFYGTNAYEGYREAARVKSMENDTPAADMEETFPVRMENNVYVNGAQPWSGEKSAYVVSEFTAKVSVEEKDGHYWLVTNLDELPEGLCGEQITTELLGKAFEPDQPYEDRDGNPIVLDRDFAGRQRGDKAAAGPMEKWEKRVLLR